MGGVPTLLLVIAFGITYGWQPDREGGVEYIIQVPPDQVERLEAAGEITSVIDPAVRGHVSRVIIRVGSGPLPQETPANLAGRNVGAPFSASADLVLNDNSPVPVPAMGETGLGDPVLGVGQAGLAEQAVMKPDTNSPPPSSGFGFPGLPPTVQVTSPQIDQAGREIPGTAGGTAVGSQTNAILGSSAPAGAATTTSGVRVQPPGTRPPSATSLTTPPPFTGTDPQGNYARARAGGPSTDPTNSRDSTWQDFPPTSTSGFNATQSSSSLNQESQYPSANTGGYPASTTGGLAPGDTYGRVPSGFSLSNTGQPGNSPSGSYGNASPSATSFGSATGQTSTSSAPPYSASQGFAAISTQTAPDPRLTPVQVASGAWTIDSYGRILDRQGRIMNGTSMSLPSNAAGSPTGYPEQSLSSGQGFQSANGSNLGFGNYPSNAGQTNSGFASFGSGGDTGSAGINSSLGQPTASGPAFSTLPPTRAVDRANPSLDRSLSGEPGSVRPSSGSMIFGDRDAIRSTSGESISDAARTSTASERRGDPPSLSDRGSTSDSTASLSRPEVVTSQPLVNGLLLISLVANVYLVFWLKNLRLQFRDLVAAKRMASSNSP